MGNRGRDALVPHAVRDVVLPDHDAEAWVSALGDAQHGFPYLSGGGRLVLKDVMLLAGGLLIMADSSRAFFERRPFRQTSDDDRHQDFHRPAE